MVSILILAALLAPAVLCALPAAPMTSSEQDCCAHMKQVECSKANMSACCTTVAPNVAIATPAVVKKVPAVSIGAVQYAALVSASLRLAIASPPDYSNFSPPGSAPSSLVQVLRI
jgi:hypothetical protein